MNWLELDCRYRAAILEWEGLANLIAELEYLMSSDWRCFLNQ